jgi:hypothetical protein
MCNGSSLATEERRETQILDFSVIGVDLGASVAGVHLWRNFRQIVPAGRDARLPD